MKILLIAAPTVLIAFMVVACGGLALTAANAPALFGDFERRANIAYGPSPRHRLDVYVPDTAGPHPVIVFWYGGAWQRGHKSQFRFVGAALAKAGYVAVLPDYRVYPEVKFPQFLADGAEALAWVVKHIVDIHGDPQRIHMGGHSAGAWIAAMLAYDAAPPALLLHGAADDVVDVSHARE